MKKIPLTYPPDHPDQELAGKTVVFHVTVMKIQEKIWPALDDTFASKVLETEGATLEDLKTNKRASGRHKDLADLDFVSDADLIFDEFDRTTASLLAEAEADLAAVAALLDGVQ
jgi:trigger factor